MRRPLARLAWLTPLLGACAADATPAGLARPGSASAHPSAVAAPPAATPSAAVRAAVEDPFPPPPPPSPPLRLKGGGRSAVRGEKGVVTSVEHHASKVGAEVLSAGGNAVDAAVATALALAVTHPSAGNVGGGGFMIVRLASGEVHAIDFREAAPRAATEAVNQAQLDAGAHGWRSIAVPGSVAGLALAAEKFGTKRIQELARPALELARKGFDLPERQAAVISWSWRDLRKDPEAAKIFGTGKAAKKKGEHQVQPDLAFTLERITKDGAKGFYEGEVASRIDAAMRKHGGLVTKEDLAAYRAKLRSPLRVPYRGFEVHTMPPPSMGGVALVEMLQVLERAGAHAHRPDGAEGLHLFVEASKRAYADRRLVGADPDFQPEAYGPLLAGVLSRAHAAEQAARLGAGASSTFGVLWDAFWDPLESRETTHLSVADAQGNAVALTTTLSAGFGARVVAAGTGVVFNNAMGAFSSLGANKLAPGKRMASSMTPTIVTRGGKVCLVLGSPGGDTIPNTVVQVLRNLVDHGMTIDEAVFAPRVHADVFPNEVRYEKGNAPPRAALDGLRARGHVVVGNHVPIGDANDVLIDDAGVAWAAADRREGGRAVGAK